MARTKKRRVERPKQAPGPGRAADGEQRPKRELKQQRAPKPPPSIEDTLFFSRIRRQAKWVFVLLALAFALTFVVFGVGSGGSGLGDVLFLGDNNPGDTPSVDEAEEAIAKNPDDANAYYELSQAHQTEGDTDEAIQALVQYTALRPKDREKLEELAGLYLAEGQQAERLAQTAQLESQLVTGAGLFSLQLQGDDDQAVDLGTGSGIEDAVTAKTQEEFNEHYSAMQTAYSNAKTRYEQVAEVAPDDPTVYQNLALAAQQANDVAAAITAYEKFLKLAPDDPNAAIIREQLKQLRAAQQPTATG